MRAPDLSPDFSEENFRRLVDAFNTLAGQISLFSNMAGQIVENIEIDAGVEVRISHNLKVVPKYKILLRHNNVDALVVDGTEIWNEKYITLVNKGASSTIISILIMKE